MSKRFTLIATILCISLLAGAVLAADGLTPRRYNPRSADRSLVTLQPSGSEVIYSAWSYRNQGGYDIAVSMRDADGIWSEPTLFGAADGIDQLQPALAIDAGGFLYLAWAEAPLGTIRLSIGSTGSNRWSAPVALTTTDIRAVSPTLTIIGDRLVAGWREGTAVVISDLGPTLHATTGGISTRTIQDGADPLGIIGEGSTDGGNIGERPDEPGTGGGDDDPGEGSGSTSGEGTIHRRNAPRGGN